MSFKKIFIEKNDSAINGEINQLQTGQNYFQDYINKVFDLGITDIESDDLEQLFANPKCFITDKLTKGETLQVAGMNLNKEKVFELLEKPAGTESLIMEIEADILDKTKREYFVWNVKNYKIENRNVVISAETLEFIANKYSLFIENENQQLAYNKLKEIERLMNEINSLQGRKISLDMELNDFMKKDSNHLLKLDSHFIKSFK
ncbi:hypothetical protein [Flavobacterium chilense]|uniref:Uncharacterized protein n=1 Tax=Flavobacterium chilense TaxID=946677 RepID=A0A1M7DQD5_9FLAO|nr:hypothetical protein [Flavobacterium chilense]SHL81607.1 hypothetical protein SAMN05444484_102674 [Flavobacterium chilense]